MVKSGSKSLTLTLRILMSFTVLILVPHPSGRGLCRVFQAAKFVFQWVVGNGSSIKFWEYHWLGNSSLAIQYWEVYVLANEKKNAVISDVWDGVITIFTFRRHPSSTSSPPAAVRRVVPSRLFWSDAGLEIRAPRVWPGDL